MLNKPYKRHSLLEAHKQGGDKNSKQAKECVCVEEGKLNSPFPIDIDVGSVSGDHTTEVLYVGKQVGHKLEHWDGWGKAGGFRLSSILAITSYITGHSP